MRPCHLRRAIPQISRLRGNFSLSVSTGSSVPLRRIRKRALHASCAHHATLNNDTSQTQRSDAEAWCVSLSALLGATSKDEAPNERTAREAASLIAEARRLKNLDLLLYLSQHGRWRETVAIVKQLTQALWRGDPSNTWRPSQSPLTTFTSLDSATAQPIALVPSQHRSASVRVPGDVDRSLLEQHYFGGARHNIAHAGHDFLGQVWQSIGNMIIEDAKSSTAISPGILELIAILHDAGIMPDSIYTYTPTSSRHALSQPPTLHLLSQHILANLSHAAWTANAGPEHPSSAFRFRVSNVRHEIWLELVLWSCLHGGWIAEGAVVLEKLVREKKPGWTPLSWREIVFPMVKAGEEDLVDWSKTGYLFNIGADNNRGSSTRTVNYTISSEVISAYVDGLPNLASVGVGARGLAIGKIVNMLSQFQAFLRKHQYGLESTSWDGIVQKLLETESFDVEKTPGVAERVLTLASTYAEQQTSANTATRDQQWRPLAPHLIDGSAITLGLTHRILQAYVQRGDFAAAFKIFRELQARVDKNKAQSLADFFSRIRQEASAVEDGQLNFQSRYTPQADPKFYTLLPPLLLRDLLDLVSEVGAHEFGSWLLASVDVDGPAIGTTAFRHSLITPALIRFLVAIRDENLLAQLLADLQSARGRKWPAPPFLLALLGSQLTLNNADGAKATVARLLTHKFRDAGHTITLVAMLARAALKGEIDVQYTCDALRAIMASRLPPDREAFNTIAALLMPVDGALKQVCLERRFGAGFLTYPHVKPFNIVLEGVVSRYGSQRGRVYVEMFCSSARDILDHDNLSSEAPSGTAIDMESLEERASSSVWNPANAIDYSVDISGSAAQSDNLTEIHIRGYFEPRIGTIRIVLGQRLVELDASDAGEPDLVRQDGTIKWCVAMLRHLGMIERDIEQELFGSYTEMSMSQAAVPGANTSESLEESSGSVV